MPADDVNVLALETATDACSVALLQDGRVRARHELVPRAHSHRLFSQLDELLGGQSLQNLGVGVIAYGCGPGSFTGLRIAASAAQGLAYSCGIGAVGISTLACQAYTAARLHALPADAAVLSTIDARIGKLYWALYRCDSAELIELAAPAVCPPEDLPADDLLGLIGGRPLVLVGSGALMRDRFPAALPEPAACFADLLPQAQDLLLPAQRRCALGEVQHAAAVQPLYVQQASQWKKLADQGPRR